MKRRQLIAALAGVAASPCVPTFAQSTDENAPVQRPDVKVGDKWTYIRTDYSTNSPVEAFELQVTFISESAILATASSLAIGKVTSALEGRTTALPKEGGETDVSFTRDWNEVSSSDGAVFVGSSNTVKFPLFVGASYRADMEYKRPLLGAFHMKYERTAKVVGWERVVVPAGEFRALKIELSGYGWRLDRRTSQSTTARWRIWYVPQVKRPVRFEFQEGSVHRGTELASFSVH
jgi:hypothetical protein